MLNIPKSLIVAASSLAILHSAEAAFQFSFQAQNESGDPGDTLTFDVFASTDQAGGEVFTGDLTNIALGGANPGSFNVGPFSDPLLGFLPDGGGFVSVGTIDVLVSLVANAGDSATLSADVIDSTGTQTGPQAGPNAVAGSANANVNAIPEPSGFIAGLAAMIAMVARRKRPARLV